MTAFDKLTLVNYCHPDCVPMMNIMRLPKAEAFELARKLAEALVGQIYIKDKNGARSSVFSYHPARFAAN